jgi:signal transduction histidine kinase
MVAADAAAQAPSSAQLATVVQRVLSRPALQLPPFALAEQQSDGTWLVVMPPDPLGSVWRYRVLLALALGSAITLPLAAYVARQIAQPVRALADAATQADLAGSGPPLAVTGPREIDAAATAFNAMRRRLADQAAERTRMVAAVAHDLRTPLTGLRLRAEQVDEPLRGRMVADIDRMRSMIDDVLEFARSQQAPLASATFDLAALARECAMLASEIGPAVSCRAPVAASCVGDEPAVRRALINLIDNAQRHGATQLWLTQPQSQCLLLIDDGTGLQDTDRQALLDRLLGQASPDHGLGLRLALQVARAHGGTLDLPSSPQGFAIRLSFEP